MLAGAGATATAGLAGLAGCGTGPAHKVDEAQLRHKAASLLVVGFRGQQLADDDWVMKAVRSGIGGVVLFDRDLKTGLARNITSPGQVTALVKQLREASSGRLIVSIDQEGGQTARLGPSDGFASSASQASIGATDSAAATRSWAQRMATELRSIGVNLNYAPVVDLNVNPASPAIGQLGRSFSSDTNVVVSNAGEEIQAHRAAGVKTVLKHFPGLGSSTANTDFAVADVTSTWQPSELEPFRSLIGAGKADSVMAAHLLNKNLDPQHPASLSAKVVTDLLRGQLGFHGPVVSDDMQAVAITSRYGSNEAVALALTAGVDLLVFANQQVYDPNVVKQTVDNVVNLVRTGRISQARIDDAVARVDTLRPES
ncbi:MAG: glycoside hydrolase family 3 protein [Micromonosporaceae bacterium]|nr:glycoside hydrolase family 3 protein [Micromonosporaceae bacterium]